MTHYEKHYMLLELSFTYDTVHTICDAQNWFNSLAVHVENDYGTTCAYHALGIYWLKCLGVANCMECVGCSPIKTIGEHEVQCKSWMSGRTVLCVSSSINNCGQSHSFGILINIDHWSITCLLTCVHLNNLIESPIWWWWKIWILFSYLGIMNRWKANW